MNKNAVARLLACVGLCSLMAVPAAADLVRLYANTLPVDQYQGNYVGPAGASLVDASAAHRWDFGIICDDYYPTTYVPSNFLVRITPLSGAGNPATKFLENAKYRQAAWLIDQLYDNIGTGTTVGQIQNEIWTLFSDVTGRGLDTGDWGTRLQTAISNGTITPTYGYNRFEVYTPVSADNYGHSPVQEFISRTTPPLLADYTVPEPSLIITLVLGAAGIAAFWRKRSIPLD